MSFHFNHIKHFKFLFQSSGYAIEGGGDIVVGQEFTDVDKGYEDGIEGEIFGFNLVHAFTSVTTLPHPEFIPNTIHFARKRNVHHNVLVPSYRRTTLRRQKRGILDMFRNMIMFFAPPSPPPRPPLPPPRPILLKPIEHQDPRIIKNNIFPTANNRILGNVGEDKPFGLLLVELGYDCLLGKGAPLHGEKVLVSWTKTTVRVFGGAMLKPEIPFCIKK